MSYHFDTPLAFLLLLLVPPLIWYELRRKPRGALRFPSTAALDSVPVSWRQRFIRLPLALRSAAMVLLIVALARPMSGRDPIRNVTEGIAIEMVVDRSGSMSAPMRFRGESLARFAAVKQVFSEFVMGDGRLMEGRPNDLIGVIAFAGFPDTISPLTNSREALAGLLKELDVVKDSSKDGTAIGDAIALGAARLKTAEQEMQRGLGQYGSYRIKSKVMIVLTDGEQNAGSRSPAQAAALAMQWGIKIYTIGMASGPGGSFSAASAELLQNMADATGGIFRVATDERSLRAVYREIDQLEKSEVESVQYLIVRDYFVPFALAALGLLLLELALSATIMRRLP
jgi:Ca-activated chloride channel family protein